MKKWLGFEKGFDFSSHEHTLAGKLKNFSLVFTVGIISTAIVSWALVYFRGTSKNELTSLLLRPIYPELYANTIFANAGEGMLFFRACVLAPLWEEVVFRVLPIGLALVLISIATMLVKVLTLLGRIYGETARPTDITPFPIIHTKLPVNLLLWTCLGISSIIFGLMHGDVMNLLFQGVTGLLFAWLFLKNNCSYASVVAAHSLWNIMVIFGLRMISEAIRHPRPPRGFFTPRQIPVWARPWRA